MYAVGIKTARGGELSLVPSQRVLARWKGMPLKLLAICCNSLFMTHKTYQAFLMTACIACSAAAQAPIDKFQYDLKGQKAEIDAQVCYLDHPSDFEECLSTPLETMQAHYKDFTKLVKGKEKRALLKAHYIALVSQMKGVEPESGELKIVYQRRQSDLKMRTKEAWMHFDLD